MFSLRALLWITWYINQFCFTPFVVHSCKALVLHWLSLFSLYSKYVLEINTLLISYSSLAGSDCAVTVWKLNCWSDVFITSIAISLHWLSKLTINVDSFLSAHSFKSVRVLCLLLRIPSFVFWVTLSRDGSTCWEVTEIFRFVINNQCIACFHIFMLSQWSNEYTTALQER
jgi:hypothetical protein